MAFLAMAFPIPANKLDEWKSFVAQLAGAKRVDFAASRKRFRVRERIFHQQTSHGDFAIVTLEGEDPADAFAKFGQGTDTFAQWYTACVLEIHGTELGKTPPDSFSALVVDSGSGQGDIFSDLAKWFG